MDSDLKKYLQNWWKYNNHNKYQKYFKEWFNNLTHNQIHYYTIEMNKPKDWMDNKLNK